MSEVDNENKIIKDFGGTEVQFDCLVTIPLHGGDEIVLKSGLGDEFGFARADKLITCSPLLARALKIAVLPEPVFPFKTYNLEKFISLKYLF